MANRFAVLETLQCLQYKCELNAFLISPPKDVKILEENVHFVSLPSVCVSVVQPICEIDSTQNDDKPCKKARIKKKVRFAVPDSPNVEPPNVESVENDGTDAVELLPMLSKSQKSVYSYMLTMKMEDQLEKVQFDSTVHSKGRSSRPVLDKGGSYLGAPPSIQMFSTLEPSVLSDIENLTSVVTNVSSGLLQSNKSLFKETGAKGQKHLLATPSSAITKRALDAFLYQQSGFEKATFVVRDSPTTK